MQRRNGAPAADLINAEPDEFRDGNLRGERPFNQWVNGFR